VTSTRADRRTAWRSVAVGVDTQTAPLRAYAYRKT
jgi:hypothetical protein